MSLATGGSSGLVELPELLENETQLDEFLTRPTPALIRDIRQLQSPLVIVGAGGKMGPTLAVLARRAAEAAGHSLEVIAVSRFSNVGAKTWLQDQGIGTISADLIDSRAVEKLRRGKKELIRKLKKG